MTSDPVVDGFSAKLLTDTPMDPLAMTARGWALYERGWAMRGTGIGPDHAAVDDIGPDRSGAGRDGPRHGRGTQSPDIDDGGRGLVPDDVTIGLFERLEGSGLLQMQDYRNWDGLEGNEGLGKLGPHASRVLSDELHLMRQDLDLDPGDAMTLMTYFDTMKYQADITRTPLPHDDFQARFGQVLAIAPYDVGAWVQFT